MLELVQDMISGENKQAVIASLQSSKKDTGSAVVQVGILTKRIAEVTEHLKTNKKDHASRRGLLQMVGQRRRHLRYISEKDSKKYLELIDKLGIRK